ncbi:MAG: (2Fe-2S)-binding protein [Anaerolineales bacterium]|nr:(2Fe-2S)-binding protein [Anaerolineales bacterium]
MEKVIEKIKFKIDGVEVTAEPGTNVLDAALENDIYIPHLCHHPDLVPAGVCRLCGVEVNGRVVMSCLTPVQEGMEIKTENSEIDQTRQVALKLLLTNHELVCHSCSANNRCELQKVASYIGITAADMGQMRRTRAVLPMDSSNPFFEFDPNKCILCGICVRTCDEIQGVFAIDFVNRGYDTVIGSFGGKSWVESTCESCGECVVRCPVGALMPKQAQPPAREVKTTCVYCGVGCGIYLGVRGDEVVSVRADRENPINKGSLCVKGRYGFKFINHRDRLKTPLIKKDGEFVEATWDEALDLVAEKFNQRKGDQFAALCSAKCTNEDNYIFQKFTRSAMVTNTIDHCARL